MTKITNWGSDDPAEVAKGGTGVATNTAYAVLCGGTTATGALQSIASVGTADQVLTSNGAGALPTFQDASGGGAYTYISTETASGDAYISFTGLSSSYISYMIIIRNVQPATDASLLYAQFSPDAGSTWRTSNYRSGLSAEEDRGSLSTVSIILTDSYDQGSSTSNEFGSYVFYVHNPHQSVLTTSSWYGSYIGDNAGTTFAVNGGGQYNSSESHDAIRFIYDAGNVSVGDFYLFGLST